MKEDESTKEQIYIVTGSEQFPRKAFELACKIANKHERGICFLSIAGKGNDILSQWSSQYSPEVNKALTYHIMEAGDDFTDFMERNEAAAVVFEINGLGNFKNCKFALKLCRELRIPYYFVKPEQEIDFSRVLVPIGFLVEEREKGVFCSGMGRFFRSELILMPAHDYGSRAKENTENIIKLLEKFQLNYKIAEAKKNSFKIEKEALRRSQEFNAGLLLISASRDYGMDDILFGPKEQRIINESDIPIMVINPRKDLYALCN